MLHWSFQEIWFIWNTQQYTFSLLAEFLTLSDWIIWWTTNNFNLKVFTRLKKNPSYHHIYNMPCRPSFEHARTAPQHKLVCAWLQSSLKFWYLYYTVILGTSYQIPNLNQIQTHNKSPNLNDSSQTFALFLECGTIALQFWSIGAVLQNHSGAWRGKWNVELFHRKTAPIFRAPSWFWRTARIDALSISICGKVKRSL